MLEQRTQIEKNLITKDEIVSENLSIANIQIQTMINGYERFWAMPDIIETLNHSPEKMDKMMQANGRLGYLLNSLMDESCNGNTELTDKYNLRVTLHMPTGYSYDVEQNLFVYTPVLVEPEPTPEPEPTTEPTPEPT